MFDFTIFVVQPWEPQPDKWAERAVRTKLTVVLDSGKAAPRAIKEDPGTTPVHLHDVWELNGAKQRDDSRGMLVMKFRTQGSACAS